MGVESIIASLFTAISILLVSAASHTQDLEGVSLPLTKTGVNLVDKSSLRGRSLQEQSTCKPWCVSFANDCQSPGCSGCEFNCLNNEICDFEEVMSKLGEAARESIKARCFPDCFKTSPAKACNWKICMGCDFCPDAFCPYATFTDITHYKFPKTDSYWHQWTHSGRPYTHEGSPLFVDLNDDGVLDYFSSMHGHGFDSALGDKVYVDRMELGESVPYDFTGDGVIVQDEDGDPDITRIRKASYRVIIDDVEVRGMDTHGQNILDLDNDGVVDMMISSGGFEGAVIDEESVKARDNFLFWGTEEKDEVTGETVTIFRGGRDAAREAGINMLYGRGRFNYMFDANGDGLIDIFCMQDRRRSNEVAPGVLLINQNNRTWKQDPVMAEYARSMILTDFDGDGKAEEVVISRAFCYPQRDGPGVDMTFPEVGPFPQEVIDFCSSRPVGTTAVYKWNKQKNQMSLISNNYKNVSPEVEKQPYCCGHGSNSGGNNCHAKSMASGDFDNDLVMDHIMLYRTKMVFYFSSDRESSPPGTLPIGPEFVGAEIYFPDTCRSAGSIRLIDLDNDGKEEILIMCEHDNMFLVYSKGNRKDSWTLSNNCNFEGSLGDLGDISLAGFTEQDLIDSCAANSKYWKTIGKICYNFKKYGVSAGTRNLKTAGISTVDLNNDGFIDIVASYYVGYTRFLHNVPSPAAKRHRFISFKLEGPGNWKSNKYAIGATIILYTRKDNKLQRQIREVSSYQHTTDKHGHKEDRIIFGLGRLLKPFRVTVKWPNGKGRTTKWLKWWKFSPKLKPIVIKPKN